MALINCQECNAQIYDAATVCPHCGAPVNKPVVQAQPSTNNSQVCHETHLTKAIFVTILCCWPLGIPAIVNVAAVSNAFIAGNYDLHFKRAAMPKNGASIPSPLELWASFFILSSSS